MAKTTASARPSANPSNANGGTAEKVKRAAAPRKPLIDYPRPEPTVNEAGETVPFAGFTEIPADYLTTKHKPLSKSDFVNEAAFFIARAVRLENKALAYRRQAEDCGKLGNVKDKKQAKKLLDMQRRMSEIKASLAAEGVDVEALLATMLKSAE